MRSYKLGILHTEISQRIAYVEAMIAGLSVLKYAPLSAAAIEMRSLCEEII
jgi:cellulose biosynthesis protein BcsQ